MTSSFKNLPRQRTGDFPFFGVRRLVETRDDLARHSDRPLDAPHQIRIDVLGRLYVPFTEEFAQHAFQHDVVGLADLGHVQGVQARAQVGQLGRPGARVGAGGEQQAAAGPGHVDQVEQRFRVGPVGVLHQHRAGRARLPTSVHVRHRSTGAPHPAGPVRARWVLPAPSGPTSARQPPCQAGQSSSAFDRLAVRVRESTKSDRANDAGRLNFKRSCRAKTETRR